VNRGSANPLRPYLDRHAAKVRNPAEHDVREVRYSGRYGDLAGHLTTVFGVRLEEAEPLPGGRIDGLFRSGLVGAWPPLLRCDIGCASAVLVDVGHHCDAARREAQLVVCADCTWRQELIS